MLFAYNTTIPQTLNMIIIKPAHNVIKNLPNLDNLLSNKKTQYTNYYLNTSVSLEFLQL